MIKSRKRAWFLLCIYLKVILPSSGTYSNYSSVKATKAEHFHTHESYEHVHHEHSFHIGVFHYLGHIVQNLVAADINTDKHIAVAQKLAKNEKYISDDFGDFQFFLNEFLSNGIVRVLVNSPPLDWQISLNLQCPSSPLRAPPAVAT